METASTGRKIVLRRPKVNASPLQEAVINRNLEPLKQNVEKKKRAQDAWYQNNCMNNSPLTRDLNRTPVKLRLGRLPIYGTNTSALLPKSRLRRFNNTLHNTIANRKTRNYSAQQRLNLIRAKNQQSLMQDSPKRMRLRRSVPLPKNYQVEILNNTSHFNNTGFYNRPLRRFKQILNRHLKMEIQKLQMTFTEHQDIIPDRVTPVATGMSTNDRFALLE